MSINWREKTMFSCQWLEKQIQVELVLQFFFATTILLIDLSYNIFYSGSATQRLKVREYFT